MKDVCTGPSLSTLEIENTKLKEELTAVRIKNDSLRDENVSIKERFQELYKSKAGSNSSVSSGATILVKPKAVASGLYAMTPKKETVTIVDLSNVPVNLPTGIKSVPDASKSKSKSDKKIHKNLSARSKKVKRVAKPLRNTLSLQNIKTLDNSVPPSNPSPSSTTIKVEVPKELPKVSMVNTSLKKLKQHLVGFDKVVKEKTTATAITEGTWGFEHTKACFRDEIIPFIKALKDIFNKFNQDLIDELIEVQTIFIQMEHAVEQHRLESKTCKVKMNQALNENDRLLEQVVNKDVVNVVMNSSTDDVSMNMHERQKCLKLETELINKKDVIEKVIYDTLLKNYNNLEKHCISLEIDTQLNMEIFQRENSVLNQSAPDIDQYFEFNELKAQSQEKDKVILKLK
ncbi:hypothetical protein Tco_1037099 [Tanacetum coccineum]